MEVDEGDVNELVAEHAEELTTEEIRDIQNISREEEMEDLPTYVVETRLSSAEIKQMLGVWQTFIDFVERTHPDQLTAGRTIDYCNDTVVSYDRETLKSRQKQASLDQFLIRME